MIVAIQIVMALFLAAGSGLIIVALLKLDTEEDEERVSQAYMRAKGWWPR